VCDAKKLFTSLSTVVANLHLYNFYLKTCDVFDERPIDQNLAYTLLQYNSFVIPF